MGRGYQARGRGGGTRSWEVGWNQVMGRGVVPGQVQEVIPNQRQERYQTRGRGYQTKVTWGVPNQGKGVLPGQGKVGGTKLKVRVVPSQEKGGWYQARGREWYQARGRGEGVKQVVQTVRTTLALVISRLAGKTGLGLKTSSVETLMARKKKRVQGKKTTNTWENRTYWGKQRLIQGKIIIIRGK